MTAIPSETEYDVIVIGSGMGGMTTAAALTRLDHKVLLFEQAPIIGGLTHSFSRNGFTWDVGLHYCGTFGRDQPAGRILDWLSGGTIEFHSVGTATISCTSQMDSKLPWRGRSTHTKWNSKTNFPTPLLKSMPISRRCSRRRRRRVW